MHAFLRSLCRRMRAAAAGRRFGVALLALSLAGTIALLAGQVHIVSIVDGDVQRTLRTTRTDPQALLALAGCKLTADDAFETVRSGREIYISIDRAEPVTVTVGNRSKTVRMTAGTVRDAIAKAGVTLDEYDLVNYNLDAPLTCDMVIDVVDIGYVTETVTEPIPYQTTTVYSNQRAKGESELQAGVAGVKEVTYRKTLVNGEVTQVQVLSETVLQDAVDGKKIVGTKMEQKLAASAGAASGAVQTISSLRPDAPIELDANGNPVHYRKHITVQATAYSYVAGRANICSTGVKAQTGYIAVNPKQIPYGTKMYIKSSDGRYLYGYAVAADTGGFVRNRPTNVDLFFNTVEECRQFGRRNVEIYILE